MENRVFFYSGWVLSFILTFLMSFLQIALSYFSRIGISRILGEEKKKLREQVLENYDELKISVDYGRIIFFLAFLVYSCSLRPDLASWPLWCLISCLLVYLVFFDYLPRLLFALVKEKGLILILPVLIPLRTILTPVLYLPRFFLKKEEKRQDIWKNYETTEEEIETFIDEATEEGIIEKDENELLRGVVEFGDRLVREIMTPRARMVAVDKNTSIGQLKEIFSKEKYSRMPVYRERLDNIEGMVIAKDLLEFSSPDQAERKIDFLIRPVPFVPETMAVKDLLTEFKKLKQKMAIVVDEYGGVSGLVTMEDLLEEIVGEIQDEYDVEEPQIIAEKPDCFLVSGETEVEEIEELLGTELSEETFLTVNGLLQKHLGRLPSQGEKIHLAGLVFEILEIDDKRIKKVRLTRTRTEDKKENN